MIVGWCASHMRAEMVLDAIEMARWPAAHTTMICALSYSDAGSQFTSMSYGERLAEIGAHPQGEPSATARETP